MVSHLEHWVAECKQVRSTTGADFLGLTRGIFPLSWAILTTPCNISIETGAVRGFPWVFRADRYDGRLLNCRVFSPRPSNAQVSFLISSEHTGSLSSKLISTGILQRFSFTKLTSCHVC